MEVRPARAKAADLTSCPPHPPAAGCRPPPQLHRGPKVSAACQKSSGRRSASLQRSQESGEWAGPEMLAPWSGLPGCSIPATLLVSRLSPVHRPATVLSATEESQRPPQNSEADSGQETCRAVWKREDLLPNRLPYPPPPSLALAQEAAEPAGLVPGVSQQRHHQLPAGKSSPPMPPRPTPNSLPLPGNQTLEQDAGRAFPSAEPERSPLSPRSAVLRLER